jgi:hypothetical protein
MSSSKEPSVLGVPVSNGPDTVDFFLQIRGMPDTKVSYITDTVDSFLEPRLRECRTGKWHKYKTVHQTTLEYLIRINKVTVEHLKRVVRTKLHPYIDPKGVTLKICKEHQTELLNKSLYNQISKNAANSLPASTLSVAVAATSSIQNVQVGDGGTPGTETKRAKSSLTPSLVPSGLGPQQPCMLAAHWKAAAAGGDVSVDSQGLRSRSESGEAVFPVLCFTGKRPCTGTSQAYSSSKTICHLQLNASVQDLDAKVNSFRAELNREIQALSFEAVIDADFNCETFLLRVKIVCTWKFPRHSATIRRPIRDIIESRLLLPRNKYTVKIFAASPESPANCQLLSGSRWLQHSPAKGSAYTMPMENFVLELGKEVRAQEDKFLNCKTQAQFMTDAKAKQVLLNNLYDVLRWRFPDLPQVLDSSAFLFRQQPVRVLEQLSPDSGCADSMDSRQLDPEALSRNSTSTPNPTLTEISSSSVAGDPAVTPFSSVEELPGPAGNLQTACAWQSTDSLAATVLLQVLEQARMCSEKKKTGCGVSDLLPNGLNPRRQPLLQAPLRKKAGYPRHQSRGSTCLTPLQTCL